MPLMSPGQGGFPAGRRQHLPGMPSDLQRTERNRLNIATNPGVPARVHRHGREGKGWTLVSRTAILLLLSVLCLAPVSRSLDFHDSTRLYRLNGVPSFAFQDRLACSVVPAYDLRTSGGCLQLFNSAALLVPGLAAGQLPRASAIESTRAGFPTPMFVDLAIKVRAPPRPLF